MEPSITDPDLDCEICRKLRVQTLTPYSHYPNSYIEKTLDEKAKYQLFHEACRRCDDANYGGLVKLCRVCSHLRHLIMCYPERPAKIFSRCGTIVHVFLEVKNEPCLQGSDQCPLCQFRDKDRKTGSQTEGYDDLEFSVSQDGACRWVFSSEKKSLRFGHQLSNEIKYRILAHVN
jgi:hypothetical protein